VPKNAKKSIISPSVAKIDPTQLAKQKEPEDIVDKANAEPEQIEVKEEVKEPEVAPEPEKSGLELQAEKITDAQIKKYWKSIENQWTTPRLHQEGVSQSEKVLRYFDVSSQYGVSQLDSCYNAEANPHSPVLACLACSVGSERTVWVSTLQLRFLLFF